MDDEQFWRLACCSRLTGECCYSYVISREHSGSDWTFYAHQSKRAANEFNGYSMGEVHYKG